MAGVGPGWRWRQAELISSWAKAGAVDQGGAAVGPPAGRRGPTLSRLALAAPGVGLAPADRAGERLTVWAREGEPVEGQFRLRPDGPWSTRNQSVPRAGRRPAQRQSVVGPGSRPAHGRGTGQRTRSWHTRSWHRSAHSVVAPGGVRPRCSRPSPTSYRSQPGRDRFPLIRPGLYGWLHRSAGGEGGVGCSDSRRRTAPHRGRGSSQRCCRRPPDSPAGFRQS